MRQRIVAAAFAVFAGFGLTTPVEADAQFWEKVKETATGAAESEVLSKVDELARGAVRCAFNDLDCIQGAKDDGEGVVLTDADGEILTDEEGNPITDPEQLPPDMQSPAAGAVDANYDFKPGEDVIYAEDYAADNLGDFPRSMEFVRGSWDVVERSGKRWLRNRGPRHAAVVIPLPEVLPQMFTIEFEAHFPHGNQQLVVATSPPPEGKYWGAIPGNAFRVGVGGNRTGVIALDGATVESMTDSKEVGEGPVPIRIMVDGQYAKMYVGTRRIANVPNAVFERTDRIYIENTYFADEEYPMLIGPIRIAAGGRDLYDVLEAKGRVAVRDILFDTDQATIKPESAERLAEIGTMLAEHPDLSLLVEGHTDGQGGFEHNMTLSRERAAAVRAWLVEKHGIAPERLRTLGLGPSQPVADNDTEEGRAQNRRVELVRIEAGGA